MTATLYEDEFGDLRNAYTLAIASDLAYLPAAEGVVGFHDKLGMEAKLISVGNTQAYIAGNDEHLLVAFRGTESPTSVDGLKDWFLTNAVNLLTIPEGRLGTDFIAAGVGARFHQGFLGAIADIWDPVYAAVESELTRLDRCFWLTGHSLGGALAMLAGWLFTRKPYEVHQIYTFGAPMIGNDLAAEALNQAYENRLFRCIDLSDPIPLLPTISLVSNQYKHCNKEMPFEKMAEEVAAGEKLAGMAEGETEGKVEGSLLDQVWGTVIERVGAHSMTNYLKHLTQS